VKHQRRGLKAVPGNRLLLESDSPHLLDVAGSINHPAHLFRVAEEVARVRGQSPLEPPSLSVAKPLHHTREPKVGSRVGVRPEFKCGLIPIETMEMNTLSLG
jgi:hypothetical protein